MSWDGYASDRDRPGYGDTDEFDEDPANVAVPVEMDDCLPGVEPTEIEEDFPF